MMKFILPESQLINSLHPFGYLTERVGEKKDNKKLDTSFIYLSTGQCNKDVTLLLKHWSYVFLTLTHQYKLSFIQSQLNLPIPPVTFHQNPPSLIREGQAQVVFCELYIILVIYILHVIETPTAHLALSHYFLLSIKNQLKLCVT